MQIAAVNNSDLERSGASHSLAIFDRLLHLATVLQASPVTNLEKRIQNLIPKKSNLKGGD